MKDIVVTKKDKLIEVKINGCLQKVENDFCYLLGNIYNIQELDSSDLSVEQKLIRLYYKYQNKLFSMLDGNFGFIMIINQEIIICKDKMGSKQFYYANIHNEFICSNNLKYIIEVYKSYLKIDSQILANYLNYNYIQGPDTIFKQVNKLQAGEYLKYNNEIIVQNYYDFVSFYNKNKNKLKNYSFSKSELENKLIQAINMQTKEAQKVGVFLSSGIDSSLITSLLKTTGKEIHSFTIGFYDQNRNEAIQSKKISKYFHTIHHEFYLTEEIAKNIIQEIPKIYSEPFADPSIIPTVFLNSKIKDIDIILTGDGADQLFCGSSVYKKFTLHNKLAILKQKIFHIFNKNISVYDIYLNNRDQLFKYYKVIPQSYCLIPDHYPSQIRYMLNDIKTFLSTRLFTKTNMAAQYYDNKLAFPFIEDEVIKVILSMKHKYKYYSKEQPKYILKNILYEKIPENYIKQKKNGFGIPLEKWLYNVFYSDIIKFSNESILEKQGLFSSDFLKLITKLKHKNLNHKECNIIFAYYIFQLWYREYIDDLWSEEI